MTTCMHAFIHLLFWFIYLFASAFYSKQGKCCEWTNKWTNCTFICKHFFHHRTIFTFTLCAMKIKCCATNNMGYLLKTKTGSCEKVPLNYSADLIKYFKLFHLETKRKFAKKWKIRRKTSGQIFIEWQSSSRDPTYPLSPIALLCLSQQIGREHQTRLVASYQDPQIDF